MFESVDQINTPFYLSFLPGRFIDERERHVLLDVLNSEIALSQLLIKKNRQEKNISRNIFCPVAKLSFVAMRTVFWYGSAKD
ncbi:MAG: hypothetical protein ACYDGO_05950 [Smithellaceae bacterium]